MAAAPPAPDALSHPEFVRSCKLLRVTKCCIMMRVGFTTSRRGQICILAAAFLLVAAIGIGGYILLGARSALRNARAEFAQGAELEFDRLRLESTLPAGFQSIPSTPSYVDAAFFEGHLFLAGAAGLIRLDADGKPDAQFRPGLELPPSAITALAPGLASDSAEPELWLATASEGILAFDGRRLRHLRPPNPAARKATALLPLGNGRIAFGTERLGVLVFDGRRIAWLHPALRNLHVTALAGDEASLWIGTASQGLFQLRAGELRHWSEAEGLPDAHITAIAIHNGQTYAGTPAGAAQLSGGQVSRHLATGLFIESLAVREGVLLAGTLEQGLIEIPLASARRPGAAVSSSLEGEIRRIVSLPGQLLAVTPGALYVLGARRHWQLVAMPGQARLTDRNISALHADPEGRLWVGYFDRGLDIAVPAAATRHIEDDHIFCVNQIIQDPARNATAVATANGLVFFDSSLRQREVLRRAEGLIANHVTGLAPIPGGLAVATPAGVTFLDAAGPRSLFAFHGLVNNHVYALASEGPRLLAGTLGGLSILDNGEVRASYTTANSGLKHNWITALVRAGQDWFAGTYGAGVERLDASGHWTRLPESSGAFVVNPNAMLATDAAVYAGTLDRGLAIYRRNSGRWSFLTRGLPSSNVTALAIAGGLLYLGTDNGLISVPEGNLF